MPEFDTDLCVATPCASAVPTATAAAAVLQVMHEPPFASPVDARRYLVIDVGVRRLRIESAGLPVVAIKGILATQPVYSRPCHAQQRLVIWAQRTAKNSDAKNLFFGPSSAINC